jgi:hypothetical protein
MPVGCEDPLGFGVSWGAGKLGFSCGRQSCLQEAFQAAVSISDEFLPLRCTILRGTKREMRANCVSGLFNGGLKGRLQARLPATQGVDKRPKASSRITNFSGFARSSCARLDKLKHVLPSGAEMSLGAADTSVRATSALEVNRSCWLW